MLRYLYFVDLPLTELDLSDYILISDAGLGSIGRIERYSVLVSYQIISLPKIPCIYKVEIGK